MKKISTYKIHELRMWLIQIVIPGILGIIMLRQNPRVRAWMYEQWFKIKCGARRMWEKLKAKFSKN